MKPENRALNRLKPKLESELGWYVEKTNNPYRSGTPDWYVEWYQGSGWIEAKFWNIKTEGKTEVPTQKIIDKCTALQQAWINRCAGNGNHVALLCFFPDTKVAAFVPIPAVYEITYLLTIPELIKNLDTWSRIS